MQTFFAARINLCKTSSGIVRQSLPYCSFGTTTVKASILGHVDRNAINSLSSQKFPEFGYYIL
ncbi:MAG: hypothetical protein GX435_07210 [Exilispira sp.]|nr:hypothetical protein [Exilispira sp.]